MPFTAIFGGTFNPLHIGHYEMLKSLQADENIEKIFLMPDKIPPHKVCDFLAEDEVRIETCRLAAEDFSKAELCLIEFEREGKSYTYDTVLQLKKKYPETEFAFVCGGDMLISFDKWYKHEELMHLMPFIVFKRTDTDPEAFSEKAEYLKKRGMLLTVKEDIINAVSSTYIRNNFQKSKNLLPPEIYKYLSDRRVYLE